MRMLDRNTSGIRDRIVLFHLEDMTQGGLAHPWFHQHNGALIAFFIPVWVGLTIGLRHVSDDPRVR